MGKRRGLLLAAVGLVAVVGLYLFIAREKEPSYNGHPLSYWVNAQGDRGKGQEAGRAIRDTGTNALSCLLRWIDYRPSPLSRWLTIKYFGEYYRPRWRWVPRRATSEPGERRARNSVTALAVLGPAATVALPQLKRLARDPGCQLGVEALAVIGPPAVPELLAIFSDATFPRPVRYEAGKQVLQIIYETRSLSTALAEQALPQFVRNLSDPDEGIAQLSSVGLAAAKTEPNIRVPALAVALTNQHVMVRRAAACALGDFGANARPALPALVKAMAEDTDPTVRIAASTAIVEIAPEVLTNTPPQ